MPGIKFINRRWNFASDDLFYPGLIEFISRLTWFCPQAFYYFQSGDIYKCADAQILHIYYIGFLCTMAAIIPIQLLIVIISAQGTITNTKPRRHMNKFLFIRMLLILFEISWSIVGTVWIASIKMGSCSPIIYWTVVLNLVFCGIAVFFLIIVVLFVFDPLSHLDQNDVTQKRNVIEYYLNKLCCCFACCLDSGPKSRESYANSYKQISRLLEMLFSKADLTPSDIAAGVMLINNKTLPQLPREFHRHTTCRKTNISQIPAWMNINAASHFIRYALATYSWPYYLYLHNMGGFCDVCCFGGDLRDNESGRCCFCCCDGRKTNVIEDQPEIGFPAGNFILVGDTKSRRNLRAFKYLAQCEECDIIYANFTNEAFLSPFCVVVDHFKKTVIITIRGTLSMSDVITDLTATCEYFDVKDLPRQPCHVGILKTTERIHQIIMEKNLLVDAFEKNPSYNLLVTGHSLGAGVATILSLKLKSDYPDIRCIAYSPPGGLVSERLSEYTKSFVLSVVVGDDIIPRLGVHSVHKLKADILREIWETEHPKYKIYWKYSLSVVKQKADEGLICQQNDEEAPTLVSTVQNINATPFLPSTEIEYGYEINSENMATYPNTQLEEPLDSSDGPLISEVSISYEETRKRTKQENKKTFMKRQYSTNVVEIEDFKDEAKEPIETKEEAYTLIRVMESHVEKTYPNLVLPGNILYIYRLDERSTKPSCCNFLCSKIFCCHKTIIDYDSRWAHRDEFTQIIITNRMLLDHFPNQVDDALNYFNSTRRYI